MRIWIIALCSVLLACSTLWSSLRAVEKTGSLYHDALAVLEVESKGLWKKIDWHEDAAEALAAAKKRQRPLFVFIYATVAPSAQLPGSDMCLGGRATLGTSLSDPRVQKQLRDFVCLSFDAAKGFPAELPGLTPVQVIFDQFPGREGGFSGSVVLAPDGQEALGTSGGGPMHEYKTAICYDAGKYAAYLAASGKRFDRWQEIMRLSPQKRGTALGAFRAEVLTSILAACGPQHLVQ